jgi:hypothetical protein
MDFRDRALFRICTALLNRQAADIGGSDSDALSSNSTFATKELKHLFEMFKSFRFMSEGLKKVSRIKMLI